MVEQPVEVDVQIAGEVVHAGRLWTHRHGQSESATFSYDEDYLQRVGAYELDPGLPLQAGQHQTALGHALFGALSDCAPDGWGRRLVRRAEAQRAREAATRQRGLAEVDFLLGARDDLRQGALRLRAYRGRRIVFTILISNTDDHLRNHGFLRRTTAGWSLSPAFDLNPNPEGSTKQLATAIDERNAEASLATALAVAASFRISDAQAQLIVSEVADATSRWREIGRASGLSAAQLERLEPAFEHEQSTAARELAASRT